jgi:hypothetical protein
VTAPMPDELRIARSTVQFAQLIYTSFDDGSSSGGWQVKAETGELTPSERQALTSRIVTRFDVGQPLPAYPTQEEISGRPSRLAYAPLTGDSAGYWHTVDAGSDGTGRPGNVMAHVVLDRSVRAPSPLRPIQLWDSPKWLRPFGSTDVAAARLTEDDLPEPSAEMGVASVVQFLTGTTVDRQSVFRVLLDAVYATMTGGPGVMLVTHDPSIGPKWIAAVSYFMSPGAARRFSWCTHDDPNLAVTDLRRGTNLVVVSEDAAKKVAGGQWVVIDDAEEPGIGELGSTHRTANGDVAVTVWSVLAEGVLESEETATRLIADQDSVATAIGDVDLSPAWPLAVAVRRDPALREYHGDANHVVAEDQPTHATTVDWVTEVVAEAVAATAPDNAQESLVRLERAHKRGVGVAVAALRLLQTALADPQWLALGPLGEVPTANVVDVEPLQPLVGAALTNVRETHPDPALPGALHLAVRIDELLGRLGIHGPELQLSVEPVRAMIADDIAGLVSASPSSPLCADTAISITTRENVLRPAVARLPATALFRIDVGVWAWLFGDERPNPVVPENPYGYDRVLLAHYIRATLEGPQPPDIGERKNRLATDGAFLALDAEELGDEDCRHLIDAISRASRIDAGDLAAMFAQQPRRIAPAVASAPIYYEDVPAELVMTLAARAEEPTDAEPDRVALTAARLRVLHHAPRPWTDEQVTGALTDAKSVFEQFLPIDHLATVADELIDVLGIIFVIAQIRGLAWADVHSANAQALATRLTNRSAALVDILAESTRHGVLDVGWFAGRALLQRVDDVDAPALLTDVEGRPGLADAVLAGLIERQAYTGPTDVEGLRNCAWEHIRAMGPEQAERFFKGYSRAAHDWLQDNRISGESGLRLGFLRPNF